MLKIKYFLVQILNKRNTFWNILAQAAQTLCNWRSVKRPASIAALINFPQGSTMLCRRKSNKRRSLRRNLENFYVKKAWKHTRCWLILGMPRRMVINLKRNLHKGRTVLPGVGEAVTEQMDEPINMGSTVGCSRRRRNPSNSGITRDVVNSCKSCCCWGLPPDAIP